MNLTLLYALAGLILFGLIIFSQRERLNRWLYRGKHSEGSEAPQSHKEVKAPDTESRRARVYDTVSRTISTETISGETIKNIKDTYGNLGRMWNKDGERLYAFVKLNEDDYKPAERYFDMSRENPPSRLYRALTQPSTAMVFDVRAPSQFMRKWGPVLLFAAGALFIMMLMVLN